MKTWQFQDAKAKFSEVVKSAQSKRPQNITVHGEPVAVLISRRDYLKLFNPKLSFVELMRSSPLAGSDPEITREQTATRKIKLWEY